MKKMFQKIASAFTVMFLLMGVVSCEEKSVSMTYSLSISSISSNMQSELSNFITKRCDEADQTIFGDNLIDSKDCEQLFNSFCDRLTNDAATQGGRVFDNTWVEFKVTDALRKVVFEKRVNFVKNADPKRYVSILFKEVAPNGDTDKATAFFDELLFTPFSMTKSSATEGGYTVNTYQFNKEYSTYAEAKAYYDSKKEEFNQAINKIKDQWPSDVLYTGKVFSSLKCLDESVPHSSSIEDELVLHRPSIHKNWTTTDPNAPFTSIAFMLNSKKNPPLFVTYKTSLEEETYEVLFLGKVIGVVNPSGTLKHAFTVLSATTIRLDRFNDQDITNGFVYTKAQ